MPAENAREPARARGALIIAGVCATVLVFVVSVLSTSGYGALCGNEAAGYCGQLHEGWTLWAWLALALPVAIVAIVCGLGIRSRRLRPVLFATAAGVALALALPVLLALLWP